MPRDGAMLPDSRRSLAFVTTYRTPTFGEVQSVRGGVVAIPEVVHFTDGFVRPDTMGREIFERPVAHLEFDRRLEKFERPDRTAQRLIAEFRTYVRKAGIGSGAISGELQRFINVPRR